jgi:hypothetical protein
MILAAFFDRMGVLEHGVLRNQVTVESPWSDSRWPRVSCMIEDHLPFGEDGGVLEFCIRVDDEELHNLPDIEVVYPDKMKYTSPFGSSKDHESKAQFGHTWQILRIVDKPGQYDFALEGGMGGYEAAWTMFEPCVGQVRIERGMKTRVVIAVREVEARSERPLKSSHPRSPWLLGWGFRLLHVFDKHRWWDMDITVEDPVPMTAISLHGGRLPLTFAGYHDRGAKTHIRDNGSIWSSCRNDCLICP